MNKVYQILLIIYLSNGINLFSQDNQIENKNSPNSINVQGNQNTINYFSLDFNEKLLKYFLEENKSEKELDLIISNIIKESQDSLSDTVFYEYAQSILNIYSTLYSNSKLILKDTLISLVNENKYIVDIGVHTTCLGHDISLAFKILPIERKAEIKDVYNFLLTLGEVKVVKGIIICNGGFSDELIQYSLKNGIDLCVLRDTKSKRWDKNIKIPAIWIKSTIKISVDLKTGSYDHPVTVYPSKNISDYKFSINNDNNVFTILDIIRVARKSKFIPQMTDSVYTYTFPIHKDSIKMRIGSSHWIPLSKFEINYMTRLEYYRNFIEPDNYEAIENYITKKAQIKYFNGYIPPFENNSEWIKIGENLKEDNSPGEKIILPVGTKIIITDDWSELLDGDIDVKDTRFLIIE